MLGFVVYIRREFKTGVGVKQNRHHTYTVFEHALLSLKYACQYNFSLEVKLAALFHDIAKPIVKRGEGYFSTFHNHDRLGAKICRQVLNRLKFSRKIIDKASHLIRQHMFFYSLGEVSDAGVRRLIRRVGKEHIYDLIDLRVADRMGSGCVKPKPYKLIELERRIKEVQKDPISVKMLKINGYDLMSNLKLQPGPALGYILNGLLEEVLDDPELNKRDYLLKRAEKYNQDFTTSSNTRLLSKEKLLEVKAKIVGAKTNLIDINYKS